MSVAAHNTDRQLLAEILDAMPERVSRYRFDDHVVVYCNTAWAEGHAGAPDELIGRPLDELLSPTELDGMWSQLAKLSRDTPLLTDTEPRRAPEDPTCWIEWVDQLITTPDGDEVLSIGRDVTARHEAQVRLGESEQRFRLAMVNAPVGMAIIGLDHRILESNAALQEFIGRSRDELQDLTWQTTTHPEDLAEEQRLLAGLVTGAEASYTLEKRFVHADGSTRWGLTTSTLIRDTTKRPLYALVHVVDVTARKLAELETHWLAEQLTTTLDRVDDGFLTLDPDWRVSHVSARGAEIFDRDVADLVGARLWDALPELEDGEVHKALQRAMSEQVIVELDRYPDLRLHSWFELAAHPSSRGLVVFFRDVTEQVQREVTLQRAVATEQQAVSRLRDLDRAKNAFLSAISHELRTPLTVVHGMAASLQRMRSELDPEVRAKIEDALVTHAEQLRGLLDELLDVDRLARGALEANPFPVEVTAIVKRAIVATHHDERLAFNAPDHLVCLVDPVQFERIVANLLGNATKYAPDGLVEVGLEPLDDHGLRLTVRDHGPGVATEERERIFEPFHRVDESHPQPGTGVGLALVNDFVHLHGGRVWVEAIPDEPGARFVVELPGTSLERDA